MIYHNFHGTEVNTIASNKLGSINTQLAPDIRTITELIIGNVLNFIFHQLLFSQLGHNCL
jgi:hypothetical protein